ncbi:PPE domain-containing protein [Actinokineospora sp. NBRC 105648]|uniref:PPE domain-containing protein n=1 Tax=Actinokineospora sp. NBRC 105648 TaxID=3032206 RepID=UPI0024A2636C|nr:PPE domain-containing protein [Actinokineospora sp. NBRC 105648]GLZ37678.1 hypothetical protein Acsp05_13030 [Actinokineospora sp. NBRC 105648]
MAMHRWCGYDHPTLHKMINGGPGPAASTPQTEYWDALNAELADIDAELNAKLATLQASWEGGAADQAHAGLTPLQAWATDAQTGATGMRASTEFQADMIARARSEMPEPVKVTTPAPSGWDKLAAGAALLTGNPGPAAVVAGQAQDHEAQESAQDEASQKAVDTMESYQSSSQFNTDTLGTFVPPPDVVVSTPPPSGGVGYEVGTYGANFSGAHGNTGTSAANFSTSHVTVTGGNNHVAPAGTGGSHFVPTVTTGGHPSPTGYTPLAGGTTPSGFTPFEGGAKAPIKFDPITTNTPTGTGGPGGGGQFTANGVGGFSGQLSGGVNSAEGLRGGGSTGARGGLGTGAGSPGGSGATAGAEGNRGQVGRGGMSGAGALGGGGENVMGTRSGASATGRGGVGAGGAGTRSGQESDEEEYETASYLVETDDVFGDDRAVSQAVLGADE